MKSSRTLALALLSGAVLVGAAGCADKPTAAVPGGAGSVTSPTPAADAKAALAAASAKTTASAHTVTMESGLTGLGTLKGSGSVDPAQKAMSMKMTTTFNGMDVAAEILGFERELYLKIGIPLPGLDTSKWLRIDASKAGSLGAFGIGSGTDPTGAKVFTDAVVTVEQTAPGKFKGTIDATKTGGSGLMRNADDLARQLGDQAKALPFEATVDGQGYLTSFAMQIPLPNQPLPAGVHMKYADFGKSVTIAKPAPAQVQEMPAELLRLLGN
jgi:hypothetical protein